MRKIDPLRVGIFLIVILLSLLSGCDASPVPHLPWVSTANEVTQCPVPTREIPPGVAKVTSPTNERSQVIQIAANADKFTVKSESGTFSSDTGDVRIDLLPDRIHHLTVEVRIRYTEIDGCSYGGYTMETQVDSEGNPLVIVQGNPATPEPSTAIISPDNARKLTLINSITLGDGARNFVFINDNDLAVLRYKGDYYYTSESWIGRYSVLAKDELSVLSSPGECKTLATNAKTGLLAAGDCSNSPLILFDLSLGKTSSKTEPSDITLGYALSLDAISINPEGTTIVTGENRNHVLVWDVSSPGLLRTLTGRNKTSLESFNAFAWIDDQTLLAAGSRNIYEWNTVSGEGNNVIPFPAGNDFLVAAAFQPEMKWLVAVAQNQYLYRYDFTKETWEKYPGSETAHLASVTLDPSARLAVAIDYDGMTHFWNMDGEPTLIPVGITTRKVNLARFSPDGKYLALLGYEGRELAIWAIP